MLEVSGAAVCFGRESGGIQALRGVTVSIAPGEIVSLVGPNGSGKSTLARLMCAMVLADSGLVEVDGVDPAKSEGARTLVRRAVGFVQQDPVDQLVSTVVSDEVSFGPRNLGLSGSEVRERVQAALCSVGLSGLIDREVNRMSGGEQQRLALAGVLAMHPRYIVLDEPTSQMDSASRPEFRKLVSRLARERGVGIVMITHDPLEMLMSDRLVVLDDGLIAWQGATQDSFDQVPSIWSDLVLDTKYMRAVKSAITAGVHLDDVRTPEAFSSWLKKALNGPGCHASLLDSMKGALRPSFNIERLRIGAEGAADSLCLDSVSFAYSEDSPLAVDDFSLVVGNGEVVLLAGPSGSGKSTAACLACGLLEPGSGSILVRGGRTSPELCSIAFQRPENQLFQPTVRDELAFAARNSGASEDDAQRAAVFAAERVGLDGGLLDSSPFELSGGQARRVGLACALSMDSPAIVLDEPTAGLDAPGRRELHGLVRALAEEGRCVLVISHDLEEWLPIVDRVALMSAGTIWWSGSAAALQSDPCIFRAAGLEPPESMRLLEIMAGGGRDVSNPAHAGLLQGAPTGASSLPPIFGVDARVKIILLFFATAMVFALPSPMVLVAGYLALAGLLSISRIDPRSIAMAARPVTVILAFTLLANLVACDGTATVPLAGPVGLDPQGGVRGLFAVMRIVLLLGMSVVVSATTTPPQVSDACVRLLRPLGRLGVPVGDIGSVLSIALRFIPVVSEEFERCRMAQRARGVDFERGGAVERVRRWTSVFTPLIIGLFRRADRLADSMAARCYADGARPNIEPAALSPRDKTVLATALAALCIVAALASAL